MAQLIPFGMAEGQHDDKPHTLHRLRGFGIQPGQTHPADTQSQGLQVKIHLLEQKADIFQIAFRFLGINGDQLGRCPGADALHLVPADDIHAHLDIGIQRPGLKGQNFFHHLGIHRLACKTAAGFAAVDHFM